PAQGGRRQAAHLGDGPADRQLVSAPGRGQPPRHRVEANAGACDILPQGERRPDAETVRPGCCRRVSDGGVAISTSGDQRCEQERRPEPRSDFPHGGLPNWGGRAQARLKERRTAVKVSGVIANSSWPAWRQGTPPPSMTPARAN